MICPPKDNPQLHVKNCALFQPPLAETIVLNPGVTLLEAGVKKMGPIKEKNK